MKNYRSAIIATVIGAAAAVTFAGCSRPADTSVETGSENIYTINEDTETSVSTTRAETEDTSANNGGTYVEEGGTYTSMAEVSAYIHEYGHLPDNYITKNEAKSLGWKSESGNLTKVAPGKSIGGDKFSNYEKKLPTKKGRKYYECDIDYTGGNRNAKRLVYSNDGLIYYTEDHYNTFEQLY